MQAIVSFFEGIGNAIVTLVDFLVSIISDTVWMIKTLGTASYQALNMLNWLPEEFLGIIGIVLSVVLIYKILGREG